LLIRDTRLQSSPTSYSISLSVTSDERQGKKQRTEHPFARLYEKVGSSSTVRDLGPNGGAETVSMAMKLKKEEAYQKEAVDIKET